MIIPWCKLRRKTKGENTMINLDMWYNNTPNEIDRISYAFYPNDGMWRGNLYKAGRIIGDFTSNDSVEIEKRFGIRLEG